MTDNPGIVPVEELQGIVRTDADFAGMARQIREYVQQSIQAQQSVESIVEEHRRLLAVEAYIRQAIKDRDLKLQAQNDLADARLRQERYIGKWLAGGPKNEGGRPAETPSIVERVLPPTHGELGIEYHQSHRWQLEASVLPEVFEQHVAEVKAAGRELTSAGLQQLARQNGRLAVHFSSDSGEWYTPPEIIERTIRLFGQIDLDPCSNPGQPNVPACHHYTQADDGLAQRWEGRIYCNPPYGRVIGDWTAKLLGEFQAGNVSEAIALLPARTDTDWFRQLRDQAVCFIDGRLRFSGQENSAPFPSAVVYFGTRIERFVWTFGDMGDVWLRWRG